MHKDCAGLEKVPRGKWYCPQHASQAKATKTRPSSAKISGDLDTSSAPSNSGKALTAGPSAPSKKPGGGGKSKGKAQSEEDSGQGNGSKKGGGKAGKKRQAETEPADLAPKATGKAESKAQMTGSSKAGKAHLDDAPSAPPGRKKTGSGNSAVKGSADNAGKNKSGKGKEDAKKQQRDTSLQKGMHLCPLPCSCWLILSCLQAAQGPMSSCHVVSCY